MAPPRKSFEVNIPVPPPINNKPENEEDEFITPKEEQSTNPPQPKSTPPPAPSRNIGKNPPKRGGFGQKTIRDLNTSFSTKHT